MKKHKYRENTQTTKHMTTKKELQTQLDELTQTIKDTKTLLQQQLEKPDYTTIRQLDWHLGWHKGIYNLEIIEDPDYDPQAITFTIKVLESILDTQN